MASITSPALSNAIRTDVPAINTILKALAKSDPSALTDIENGTKRIVEVSGKWNFQELVDGSWVTRKSFNIDASSLDGKAVSVDATANTIPVRNTDGKLEGDITGNATTATKATTLASTLAVPGGGTGGTTAAAARTNLDVPPTSHASTTTIYGVSSDTQYGHSMASSTTPKALGTAAVGSETVKFARGDHVHPVTTATASVLGSVKLSDSTSSTSDASAGVAASPKAVKAAYDQASTATTNATNAQTTADSAASAASKAQTTADNALATAEEAKDTAANIIVPVTSVNGMTGEVTVGTVRSVNGVNADAAGNVGISSVTTATKATACPNVAMMWAIMDNQGCSGGSIAKGSWTLPSGGTWRYVLTGVNSYGTNTAGTASGGQRLTWNTSYSMIGVAIRIS